MAEGGEPWAQGEGAAERSRAPLVVPAREAGPCAESSFGHELMESSGQTQQPGLIIILIFRAGN